ncbi:hypothetical protein GCM10022397_34750 [Flavivirga jejuensis]
MIPLPALTEKLQNNTNANENKKVLNKDLLGVIKNYFIILK